METKETPSADVRARVKEIMRDYSLPPDYRPPFNRGFITASEIIALHKAGKLIKKEDKIMTELVKHQPTMEYQPAAEMEAMLNVQIRKAELTAKADMVPDKFRNKPANILMAQEIAHSMGDAVWIIMKELYFVGNIPTFSAKYMRARIRGAGHILRESFDEKTGVATCVIIRKDDPDYEHVITWDKAKADAHGLWGKGHWKKNPELMLKNRAVSENMRQACSEVMGGVLYTPEEAEDMQRVRMSSKRLPSQGGGLKARLGMTEPTQESAPEQPAVEAPKPEDDFLTTVTATLAGYNQPEQVKELIDSIKGADDVPEKELEQAIELGRQRWNELSEEA